MKKLSPEALAVLDSDVIIRGSFLSIEKPLDRKLYVEVNAALEALGGKWDRKSKAHVFGEGPADALDQVIELVHDENHRVRAAAERALRRLDDLV